MIIEPFMTLGMPIREGDAAGFVVVSGGEFRKLPRARLQGRSFNVRVKLDVVNAVGMLVHKNPGAGRAGVNEPAHFRDIDKIGRPRKVRIF